MALILNSLRERLGDEAGEHWLHHQCGARRPRREAIGKRRRHHQETQAQAGSMVLEKLPT
jgi:hypothetical protein